MEFPTWFLGMDVPHRLELVCTAEILADYLDRRTIVAEDSSVFGVEMVVHFVSYTFVSYTFFAKKLHPYFVSYTKSRIVSYTFLL